MDQLWVVENKIRKIRVAEQFGLRNAGLNWQFTNLEIWKLEIQADLVICGLFICEFAYMRLRNIDQNSLYAMFCSTYLAYMRFFMKNLIFNLRKSELIEKIFKYYEKYLFFN